MTGDTIIDASGVRKRFGDQPVLRGLDLSVRAGELVVLMGPNGVGKSVFLSCLASSTAPDGGEVALFGDRSPKAARDATSVMLQGTMTDPDLTGRENLRFYEDLHPRGTDRWRDLVDRLGIADDLDRPVEEYSGGMERKIELTVALSADVPLYLLDEPTAELDLTTIRTLHDILLERRDEGAAVLFTSHSPLDARIADRIALVRDGRDVASGRPDDLFDALPRVLRVRGAVPPDDVPIGGHTFRRGDEIRAFLPDDVELAAVEDSVSGQGDPLVEIDPPSYTDLFNYYTRVEGDPTGADEGKGTGAVGTNPATTRHD